MQKKHGSPEVNPNGMTYAVKPTLARRLAPKWSTVDNDECLSYLNRQRFNQLELFTAATS